MLRYILQVPRRSFLTSLPAFKITPFLLADVGEGITECELVKWYAKPGDKVAQFDKICEVQSDKAVVEITSRYDGRIVKLHWKDGEMAAVGKPLVDIDVEGEETSVEAVPKKSEINQNQPTPTHASPVKAHETKEKENDILTTPAVRRVAKENNVDLSLVRGSGKDGRITKEDVFLFIESKGKESTQKGISGQAQAPQKTTTSTGELQKLTAIQRAMYNSMTKSLKIPHFGLSEQISMNECVKLRRSINDVLENDKDSYPGLKKISYMPIMIKAMSLALTKYPILNSRLVPDEDPSKASLIYRSQHNIGIAMDTPQGLLVPNIKNVESKSILEIAQDLNHLRDLATKGKLSKADLSEGTITLSNIGNIAGSALHPVIVSSEVCIGAIGKIRRLPVFETVKDDNGKKQEVIVAKELMDVSWNADHRIIDGATLARFVKTWKEYLEEPQVMLLSLR